MTELVLHTPRSSTLVELARRHVADGSVSSPETPALLRRVARERLGAEIALALVVVVAVPLSDCPKDDFALVEHEVRPGVRNYRLARVPRNDEGAIRFGAFERAVRRRFLALARRLGGALRGPVAIAPAPEAAFRLGAGREDHVALLPGPSRC